MTITKPASGDVIPVLRGNAYSIGTTAPAYPTLGDMWADTSYANPPGPQLKIYMGAVYGWQLWKASFLDAKQIVGTVDNNAWSSFASAVSTVSGLNIPASSGIGISGTLEWVFSGGVTTAGCSAFALTIVLNSTTIVNGAYATITKSNTTAYTGTATLSFDIYIPRRDGGYPVEGGGSAWKYGRVKSGVSAPGVSGVFTGGVNPTALNTVAMPTVAITSVGIGWGVSGTAPAGNTHLAVYEWDEGG